MKLLPNWNMENVFYNRIIMIFNKDHDSPTLTLLKLLLGGDKILGVSNVISF